MAQVKVNNISYDLLSDGQLADISEWNESLAEIMAAREGIILTAEHWQIIQLMRAYYREFNISPIRKLLKNLIAQQCGVTHAQDDYLNRLFPRGVQTQGTRIAGIPVSMLDAEREHSSDSGRPASDSKNPANEFLFAGKIIKTFPTGNLVNLDDWNAQLAIYMAQLEGINLTPDHWEVLRFLRKFYFQYGIAPMVRLLMKHFGEHVGHERSSKEYLYQLFPGGPAKQGSRIAGLPQPQGCID